jgi:hypothetical protein
MNKPGIVRFYLLHEPNENGCVADLNESDPYEMEKIRCPIKSGHARGRRNSQLDMVVPCDPAPDVIFTWMSECLIQEPVRLIFESEGLTGFSALPAKAKIKKTGAAIPVHELAVTGWGGMAPQATGIREVERCPGSGHLRYSALEAPEKLIDPNSWDGSDFFMIWPLPRFRFVTERVVETCQRHGITGLVFLQNWPTTRTKSTGYSPGRLSYYMPKERAHLLGDALGIE